MRTPMLLGAHFLALVAFALSKGMTLEDVEAVSGVAPDEIIKPDTRVPEMRMVEIWRELFRRFPEQPLPIEHVRGAPLAAIAGMAYSARYASDVRRIFELILRNQHYSSEGTSLALVEDGDEAHFTVSHVFDDSEIVPKEVALGVCWRVLSEVLELNVRVKSVSIGRSLSCDIGVYEAFFGAPVLVKTPDYRLTVDRAILDLPSKDRNEDLSRYAEYFFNLAIEKEGGAAHPDYRALVSAIAESAAAGEFRVGHIARHAAMSVRTAQRVAARHGTTLKALIQEARFSRAKQLLRDGRVTLTEVAFLVGYSDDRAFRRAFKANLGLAPSQFRKESR